MKSLPRAASMEALVILASGASTKSAMVTEGRMSCESAETQLSKSATSA